MILRVRNWKDFQHYKDRAPPWIRLHRALLDNKDFHRLPVESRALAPMLWLLASESIDGVIDATADDLAFRLRTNERDILLALTPLIEKGFFVMDPDASNTLASCDQVAVPETEALQRTETETETEAEAETEAEKPTRAPRKSSTDLTPQDLVAEGVELQHAKDWRTARKCPVTQTAWDELKAEARKAGITPGEAVRICAIKAWRGFDSTWKWQQHAKGAPSPSDANAEAARILGFSPDEVIDA